MFTKNPSRGHLKSLVFALIILIVAAAGVILVSMQGSQDIRSKAATPSCFAECRKKSGTKICTAKCGGSKIDPKIPTDDVKLKGPSCYSACRQQRGTETCDRECGTQYGGQPIPPTSQQNH